MIRKFFTPLNAVFIIGFSVTVLVIFGYLPRQAAFFVLALYLIYIIFAKTQNGVNLFLRSIPFFIALPISEGFDNFDMGRLVLFVLFAKWLITDSKWFGELAVWRGREEIIYYVKHRRIELLGLAFFVFAFFSLFVAFDPIPGMKRMIFIANAAFLFIILRGLIMKNKDVASGFVKNFVYSGLLAVMFGYLQFVAAYFSEAYIFHYWWGQLISLNMYGRQWADIVTNFGNTWFSYSGDTLRLRMFSTFPDSHSFPMYVLMTFPAMFFVFFRIFKGKLAEFKNVKYGRRIIIIGFGIFVLANLALILSGTRGIWLSSLSAIFVLIIFKKLKISGKFSRMIWISFIIFLAMFPIYFVIVSFPQFQETDFTSAASLGRFRSIIDFGETSNQGRIHIWKESIGSIVQNPVIGVGIGNYPTVLGESLSASEAGASAHNLYLHIASTIGVFGLVVFLWMIWEILKISVRYIKKYPADDWAVYFAMFVYSAIWLGTYLMTDAALYDGRALLGFMAISGISVGVYRAGENKINEKDV
ncbi:MAG: O-antigen ligase family protein [Candidatus Spechtbacterales bacterium]